MQLLPLEVQQHIGLYLPPDDYKQFRMSFRNFLPLRQRIKLRSLMLCGHLEDPSLYQRAECFKGLQFAVTDQLSSKDWLKFEKYIWMKWWFLITPNYWGIFELYFDVIRMILKEIPVWFDTQRSFDLALRICCQFGEVDLVQPLLNNLSIIPNSRTLEYACSNGNPKIVELLLKDGRIFTQATLGSAIDGQNVDIVKLLLEDPRTNLNSGDALGKAITVQSVPIMELLLKHESIDPSVNENHAVRMAVAYGVTDIVRLLLQDPRVDPSAQENDCICMVSERCDIELVKLLLQDPRVDPSAEMNECLGYAVLQSNLELAQILLDDYRFDPTEISGVILKAVGAGSLETLKFLLNHPKLDLDLERFDKDLVAVAAAHNNIAILQFLLDDVRLIPKERAVSGASSLGFINAVEILLSDSRLDLRKVKSQYYLHRAKKNKTPKIRDCNTCECKHYCP